MKKSTKIMLITSVSLIAGGVILVLVCMLFGGRRSLVNMMEQDGLVYDMPGGNVVFSISPSGIVFSGKEEGMDEYREITGNDGTSGKEKVADAAGVTVLDLSLAAGTYEIKKSPDSYIYIEEDGVKLYVKENGEKLSIRTKDGTLLHSFGLFYTTRAAGSARLYLPEKTFDRIRLELGAGQLTGSVLSADRIDVSVGAGELVMEELTGREIEVECGAGEVTIDTLCGDDVDLEIGMGQFRSGGEIKNKLTADVGMGELEMVLYGGEEDFNVEAECGAGNIIIGNRSFGGVAGSQKIERGAQKDIEVDCGMGSASIRFEREV